LSGSAPSGIGLHQLYLLLSVKFSFLIFFSNIDMASGDPRDAYWTEKTINTRCANCSLIIDAISDEMILSYELSLLGLPHDSPDSGSPADSIQE
jgi:hypothetical protein